MTSSKMMIAALILVGAGALGSTWLWFVPKPSHEFTIAPAPTSSQQR